MGGGAGAEGGGIGHLQFLCVYGGGGGRGVGDGGARAGVVGSL